MENLHLIVGLGNPGAKYARTRHNIGFLLVERLAERWKASWTTEKKFQSQVARVERNGRTVLLAQPQTFMNASGETRRAFLGDLGRYGAGALLAASSVESARGFTKVHREASGAAPSNSSSSSFIHWGRVLR